MCNTGNNRTQKSAFATLTSHLFERALFVDSFSNQESRRRVAIAQETLQKGPTSAGITQLRERLFRTLSSPIMGDSYAVASIPSFDKVCSEV